MHSELDYLSMKKLLITFILSTLIAVPALAQESDFSTEQAEGRNIHSLKYRIYKWTDERGNVHYTQYKPKEAEAIELDPPPPPPSYSPDVNAAAGQQIDQGASSSQKQKEQNDLDKQLASAEGRKQKNCETAKKNLETLKSQPTVSYTDKSGAKVRMSEEIKDIKRREAQRNIDYFCN